ncbi:MAG: hypothetical protein AAFY71_14180 [Bacteroidota bacterium]
MINKRIFGLVLIGLTLFACEDQSKKQIGELHKQVMDLHDVVMAEYGSLEKMGFQLKDSLAALNEAGTADETTLSTFHAAIQQNEKGIEGMNNWMRGFDQKYEEKGPEKAVTYLKEQLVEMEKVKKDFDEATQAAKAILE